LSAAQLSKELAKEAIEAFYANGQNKAAAARALNNMNVNTYKDRLNVALGMAGRGEFGTDPVIPGFAISQVSTEEDESGKTVRRFIQQKPEHGGPFNLPDGHSLSGVSALLDAQGNVAQQWVKTKADHENPAAIADAIKAALEGFEPVPALTPPRYKEDDLATVYPVADFHIGLLAWRKEVGQDYDLTIAQRVIKGAAERLLSASPFSEQAVILGLGDLLHADNFKNQTPQSGNQLDVDGRYPKSLRVATELLLHIISQALQRHDRVLVRILPGNHDEQSSIAVSLALAMYYANEPRVTVDDSPSRFWFWSWGDVLLGATHGDKAKMADLPLIMASRNAEAWGRSKFRHLYTGHIHTQTGIEKSGVTVESFQTPAAADAWHFGMGYGAGRSLTAITHHKKLGEILRNKVNIVGE
jgi:hypothetical protein